MPHLLRHRHTYTLLSLSLIDNLTVSNLNIYQDVIKAAKSIVWIKNIIGLFNPFDLLLMSQFYLELKMGHKNSMNILTHFMSVNQISYIYSGILYFWGVFFRPQDRTLDDLEIIYEELLHIKALSHLSTSVKRELASVLVFESHAKAGTVCMYMHLYSL